MAENPNAARLEAILLCYLSAESPEQLEGARAVAQEVMDLSDDEVLDMIQEKPEEPVPHARPGEPDQYRAAKVPEGYTLQGLPGGSFTSGKALAEFYSDLFSNLSKAGALPPSEIQKAQGELSPVGWMLRHDEKGTFWPMEVEKSGLEVVGEPGIYARGSGEAPGDPLALLGSDRLRELAGVVKIALQAAGMDSRVRQALARALVLITGAR